MIIKTFASIEASGEQFSPAQWEKVTGMACQLKHERGEIGTRGRFLGSPYPDGYGSIDFMDDHKNQELFSGENENFWPVISKVVLAARALHAEHVKMSITVFYSAQCNLWFDIASIARLHDLNIPIGLTCVEDSEDEAETDTSETEKLY